MIEIEKATFWEPCESLDVEVGQVTEALQFVTLNQGLGCWFVRRERPDRLKVLAEIEKLASSGRGCSGDADGNDAVPLRAAVEEYQASGAECVEQCVNLPERIGGDKGGR